MPDDGSQHVNRTGGAFIVWPADSQGRRIDPPRSGEDGSRHLPNPAHPDAVELFIGLPDDAGPPPKEQVELLIEIEKLLRVVQSLYRSGPRPRPEAFRIYYVKLFYLAQLGLEGPNAVPDIARSALAVTAMDLIDDEAGNIKNAYLKRLGLHTVILSVPFLALYCVAFAWQGEWLTSSFALLRIDRPLLASFCMLWVGCFHGVWLSYGIRKAKIGIADLTAREEDRMQPLVRLLFAGLLTFAIGLMVTSGVVDIEIGSISLTRIIDTPTFAYLVGMCFGIAELALPASIGNKANTVAAAIR
ncbi:hypothetical protein OU994_12095 [Pseudoduganella sp. SL102]|uniref:hypothetical protein n=1 Tax=Pseudoduganella sp. SL102 TaxID=2995154 RepID=UPI00248CCC9D|nr:hypothetical protein [Pseudoduganella sp. SL102]WBS04960.1 hypothetical protein OU994_12095 [Pseudoduganella sp. SL102]